MTHEAIRSDGREKKKRESFFSDWSIFSFRPETPSTGNSSVYWMVSYLDPDYDSYLSPD